MLKFRQLRTGSGVLFLSITESLTWTLPRTQAVVRGIMGSIGPMGHKGQKPPVSLLSACLPVRVRLSACGHTQAGAFGKTVAQASPPAHMKVLVFLCTS